MPEWLAMIRVFRPKIWWGFGGNKVDQQCHNGRNGKEKVRVGVAASWRLGQLEIWKGKVSYGEEKGGQWGWEVEKIVG